jgi:hypothetical protein
MKTWLKKPRAHAFSHMSPTPKQLPPTVRYLCAGEPWCQRLINTPALPSGWNPNSRTDLCGVCSCAPHQCTSLSVPKLSSCPSPTWQSITHPLRNSVSVTLGCCISCCCCRCCWLLVRPSAVLRGRLAGRSAAAAAAGSAAPSAAAAAAMLPVPAAAAAAAWCSPAAAAMTLSTSVKLLTGCPFTARIMSPLRSTCDADQHTQQCYIVSCCSMQHMVCQGN